MHETKHKLVGEFTLAEKQAKGIPAELPDNTHIVEGQIEGHGTTEFASTEAKLSGRLLSTERTDSGGIKYQLALYAHEPVKVVEPVATTLTPQEEASQYLQDDKGLGEDEANYAVAHFGHTRILAEKEKDKDKDFEGLMKGRRVPSQPPKKLNNREPSAAAPLPFTPGGAGTGATADQSRAANSQSTLDSRAGADNDAVGDDAIGDDAVAGDGDGDGDGYGANSEGNV